MNVVIRVSDSDRARVWGHLVSNSPGTALPNNTFIVSDAAARSLRDSGIEFDEISRDQQPAAALIGTLDMNDPEAKKWWQYVESFRDECDSLTFPGESSGDDE